MSKDWTEDFSHENGYYINTCSVCKSKFMGHKRRPLCKECYEVIFNNEPEESCIPISWFRILITWIKKLKRRNIK